MDSKKNWVTSVQDVTPYKKSLQVIKGIKLKNISNESNTIATLSYEDLRKKYLVNLDGPEETDPIALEVLGKNGPRVLGMYGGITLITAKAKSGKTFASSLFISALVKGQELSKTLKPSYLENRRTVIFFDTEQREGSIKKLGRRIWALAETQNNFEAFKLRAEQNNVRADIIEQIIYNSPGLAAIVIDGVRDLIYDINNSQEAASVSSRILKWAEDLNILIIVILHQNKNDNNARGHFGTELKNKAEV
ncbi:MAG TPA: AAA family ATPase, partial [Chondromyces sp.]|nr:AAA family ATPase [Chondromyces sp.]